MSERPEEPWLSFLTELDQQLDNVVDFHCIGGFVVSQHYGFGRETGDLDVLSVFPAGSAKQVFELAGKGSNLHRKHRVYVDHVRVASYPESYATRIVRVFPTFERTRLWALEAHDLALTKLERSIERDIRDVMFLAQAGLLQRDVLVSRFEAELEPYLIGRTPTWHRTTLQMWLDSCWPE